MAQTFSTERLIRLAHCDSAGIVFFPRVFEMVDGAVEDWLREAIGLPFNELHFTRRLGLPIVSTACEFTRPCRLGDRVVFELAIARLGRSSIEFLIRGRVAQEEKFRVRHKVALVSLERFEPVPIPEGLRAKMQPYVSASEP